MDAALVISQYEKSAIYESSSAFDTKINRVTNSKGH